MSFQVAPAVIIDGTLYTLLAFSVITWSIILFKALQFALNGYYNRKFLEAFWDMPDLESARKLSSRLSRGPKAHIAERGFAWLNEMRQSVTTALKYQGLPRDLLEEALRAQTQTELRAMERGLTTLASIGATAPFVGLFGTVLGIMNALQDISKSQSASIDVVAGPIGDALIATAIGIAVAVPAVLAYNFLLRRAKHHQIDLEHFVDGFLRIASQENLGS